MQIGESVSPPRDGQHDSSCPFCGGAKPETKGYHTKHGELKDERELARNLAKLGDVTSDPKVGAVYPMPGGGDPHEGWIVDSNVFEEFPVEIRPTPHHLIPGKAAMAPSSLEEWTCAAKGKIKEDIGYSIDGAQNGIWLPHLPHIHWTRYMNKLDKIRFSDVFGTWGSLSDYRRKAIGYIIMAETFLQMHYTDHDDPYVHVDNDTTYDDEACERCNLLGDLMSTFWAPKCPESQDAADSKYYPPYGLVHRINMQSTYMRDRITGRPTWWRSWVSPLAQDYSADLKADAVKLKLSMVIKRK
jgi:hypothetical protein